MKNRFIWYILTAIGIMLALYIPHQFRYEAKHPSLNEEADFPDIYFKNVKHYAKENRYERSVYHLEQAINSIRKIETDIDDGSINLLEDAILDLEIVQNELLGDSLKDKDMLNAFEKTLNTLALAELKVSEMYAETNHRDLANMALKHAYLHIKNAMLFENSIWFEDSMHLEIEKHVYYELDSLLENQTISPIELADKINTIIVEIDRLIASK
jgi:hypothetical protein